MIANLFMKNFEEKAISSFHNLPRCWGRYGDDTMVIIDRSLVNFNSVHNSIKLTIEHENNNSIAMLNTLTTHNPMVPSLSVCTEKKYTHGSIPVPQFLQSPANQVFNIRTLNHRTKVLSSDSERLEQEIDLKGHITKPYVQDVSEPLSRLNRKTGVVVHGKPTDSIIRSILLFPKNKPDKLDNTGTVCQECPANW